jgi:hypothetical protein
MSALTDPHPSLVRPVSPRTPGGCRERLMLADRAMSFHRRRSGARTTARAM